jgi:hypothetical protein
MGMPIAVVMRKDKNYQVIIEFLAESEIDESDLISKCEW